MAASDGRNLFPYRPMPLADLQATATGSPAALPYLLAVKFNYDVNQGGFAQLLYNLKGKFLADVENMLIGAKAAVAHDYYVVAVRICLKDKAGYFRFLASDYLEANAVKHALQLLSFAYLQRRVDFIEVAAAYLARLPRP